MEVQITTDHNIEGSMGLNEYLGATLKDDLARFGSHLTKVDVHLADENSHKDTPNDKRCILQASVKGRPPIVVKNHADTVELSFTGALSKLVSSLDSQLDKLKNR